jgi:glycosyltransferase involved in cell wall biosynthesis
VSGIGITVGVATCGRPDGLARCLRALAAQTTPAAEVIVVDQDPSEEARAAVAASPLAAVRYLEQPRLGLSASRNLALGSASETVLAVTDDDCVPEPTWVASIVAALERPPAPDAVTGRIVPLGPPPPGAYAISMRESEVPVDHVGRAIPWDVGTGGNFAARVATLRACKGWDERLGTGSRGQAAEDVDLFYRLLVAGSVVRYEPAAVVRHEWSPRARRLATRWSYGYGVGAMSGLWLARRDLFSMTMMGAYARPHVRSLLGAVRRRDRNGGVERVRALTSLVPGIVYGLRAARRPSVTSAAGRALLRP